MKTQAITSNGPIKNAKQARELGEDIENLADCAKDRQEALDAASLLWNNTTMVLASPELQKRLVEFFRSLVCVDRAETMHTPW